MNILESSCGVTFRIMLHHNQYRVYLNTIPSDNGENVEVYGRVIKKYNTFTDVSNWFARFEAIDDKQSYIAKFLIGKGKQKGLYNNDEMVVKRCVTKQLFVRRDKGGYRRFDTYYNPVELQSAVDRFRENGYEVFTETGKIWYEKIPSDQINEYSSKLIFEDKPDSYGTSKVKAPKKSRSAKFWNNR